MIPSENPYRTVAANSFQKRRLGLIICLAISAGTALVWLLERNGATSYSGEFRAKMTVVTSQRNGKVEQILVRTGQSVVPGDSLIHLVDPLLESRQIGKRREIAEFEAEVARARATFEIELAWRRRDLQAEIFEMQLKLASLAQDKLNKQVEEIAWKERLSHGDLHATPFASNVDVAFHPISMETHLPEDRQIHAMLREDAAAAAAETLTLQITLCEKRLKNLQTLDQELESKIRASSGIELAETRLNGAQQELSAALAQANDLTVISPAYGIVSEVKVQPGDLVSNGATLVEILDESQPNIVAQIPAGIASRLQSGSRVTLVFPMNERRNGVIVSIPSRAITNQDVTQAYVAVKIEPAGKLWPKLASGSAVKVQLH